MFWFKNYRFLLSSIVFLANLVTADAAEVLATPKKIVAEWSILINMQSDNNLLAASESNIKDLEYAFRVGNVDGRVNVLIQMDKPADRNTWRYKITKNGRIDAGTLIGHEMGYNPVDDVVSSVRWMKDSFPANHYMLVLSNHGGGVRTVLNTAALLFGNDSRGIFYDDSQRSYLTIPMVGQAITQCKTILGKNLDCLGCDACLMQMAEICYEVKDCVDFSVASQDVEDFYGWPYSKFLIPLLAAPTTAMSSLAQNIVKSYDAYYRPLSSINYYTLSAVQESCILDLKNNIDQMAVAVNACNKIDAAATKKMVQAARKASLKFYDTDFIDLASFYLAMSSRAKSGDLFDESTEPLRRPKPGVKPKPKPKPAPTSAVTNYKKALEALRLVLASGIQKINSTVYANATGSLNRQAKGISIYFPAQNPFNGYAQLAFSKQGLWLQFIKTYR